MSSERDWYDAEYDVTPTGGGEWDDPHYPMNKLVLRHVGDLAGKDVLLLGNGTSRKELAFLDQRPRRLIFSDISPMAIRAVEATISHPALSFACIDATALPFPDRSLDVVYGYAFVHHLADPAPFLREAARVLRPGGRAVFMDNRRSPVYQAAKTTILRPLMRYYHRRGGISPADLHATLTGWYNERELAAMMPADVTPFFDRSLLVHYLVCRAAERLPPRVLWDRYLRSRRPKLALAALDDRLGRFAIVRANQIRLVWGFTRR